MATQKKDDIPAQSFTFRDEIDEAGRIPGFAGRIEEDLVGGGVAGEKVVAIRVDFAHGDGSPAAGTLQEFFGDGVGMDIPGFADI